MESIWHSPKDSSGLLSCDSQVVRPCEEIQKEMRLLSEGVSHIFDS